MDPPVVPGPKGPDLPKDTLLKNAPPAVDQQLRVVDMGKYNLAVGIIHRGPTKDEPGTPAAGPYHDRVLPGGYVNPLLVKNVLTPVK